MYTSITNRGVSLKNKMIENYYILNQIAQTIDTGVVIIYEKSLLYVNNEMRRITSRTYKDLESSLTKIILPTHLRNVIKAYVSVLKEFSDREELYFEVIMPNGSLKTVKCRFTRIKIFDKNGIFASIHEDFSELKHASLSKFSLSLWRKYRADYEHILNNRYDFLIFIDPDYKVLNVGRNIEQFIGYKRTEFIGKRFSSVCNVSPLDDLSEVLYGFSQLDNTSTNRVVKNLSLTLTSKSNTSVQFSVSIFPVKIGIYTKGFCLVFCQLNDNSKTALSADEVAANIAHEFRSPLNAIIGFSNIIADDNLTPYERKLYLKYVKQSCNSLLNIVNDFSDFNKLNHNKIVIHKDDFNINSLFDQLEAYCSMYKKDYNKSDIQVIVSQQFPDKDIIVNGDQQRIFQIMVNLLNNAFKYTDKGFIKYQYIIENNFLVLKVSDSGIGISKENLGKIFNRLIQLDVNNCNKGSGLGLTISKNLVDLMGGTITVNSEVGVGTEFLIKIPLNQTVKDIPKPQNKMEAELDFSDKSIIIAEDAQINYILLQKILEKTKVKIYWAQNGQQCLDLFNQHRDISLILMDMLMPVIDGFEATKRILEIDSTVPIIAQTAFSFAEEKKRIMAIGCVDFIAKPIDRNTLLRKMQNCFR